MTVLAITAWRHAGDCHAGTDRARSCRPRRVHGTAPHTMPSTLIHAHEIRVTAPAVVPDCLHQRMSLSACPGETARNSRVGSPSQSDGMTLIELAVVMVIIGLLLGGVLLGRELVEAAEIRATVSQVESINAAATTFRLKYGGVPGDLHASAASAISLFAFTGASAGYNGMGDGDGMVEGPDPSFPESGWGIGETLAFWRHLSDTGLISGSFGTVGNSSIGSSNGMVAGQVTQVWESLPRAAMGHNAYYIIYSGDGYNYLEIAGITSIDPAGGYSAKRPPFLPRHAYAIDSKKDDGMPHSGQVVARQPFSGDGPNMPCPEAGCHVEFDWVTECVQGQGPDSHYVLTVSVPRCNLRIRMDGA